MAKQSTARKPAEFTTFGELLRHLRERVHLTQREFAGQVGYHYSFISRLEKNERSPDHATLIALFVPALGLDDEPQWTERLLKLAGDESKASAVSGLNSTPPSAPAPDTPTPGMGIPLNPTLPVSLNPLLGRERESMELPALLARDDVRLVTLVGAPGVGKTRLALHIAHQLQNRFAHGVLFLDLTKVDSACNVIPAFADALGVADVSETHMQARVIHALRQRDTLLLVDNFEHVLDTASEFVQILGNSPQVKALVTSREALNVPGEHEYPVKPLPLPQTDAEAIEGFASVQLFIQRAQTVQAGFQLTKENRAAVAELCRRLDGLPLAIELAAPRIKALTPQAMLKQFERRFDWSARRRVPAAQTLRGALEWSHNLLSEKTRACFRRLSVFSGGWSIEAAEVVCADPDALDSPSRIDRTEVFNLLMQLSDKSMVMVDPCGEETRFRFLETIRDFAREKLSQSPELELVRNRHLAYFADFAEQIEAHLLRAERVPWIRVGEEEQSNFDAAFQWGLKPGAFLQDGLRLIAAVALLWLLRNRCREGFIHVSAYLSLAKASGQRTLWAKILYRAGAIAGYLYDHPAAYTLCKQSIEIYRTLADQPNLARALYHFGEACYQLEKLAEARAALEECARLCRENDDPVQLGLMLTLFGMVRYYEGSFEGARDALEEALALASRINNPWGLGNANFYLGAIYRYSARYDAAIDCFLRSLDLFSDLGDRNYVGYTCANLSIIYNLIHRHAESSVYAERTFAIFQSLGDDAQLPFPLRMMAYSAIHVGNLARARALIRESAAGNRAIGHLSGQVACLIATARVRVVESDAERAVSLCALVEAYVRSNGVELLDPDSKALKEVLALAEESLDEAAFQSAYVRGQAMDVETEIMNLMARS